MLKLIAGLAILMSSVALAQVPTQALSAPVPAATLPKACGIAGGQVVYCPSNASDSGTQLLYNGQPVGGGAPPITANRFTINGLNEFGDSITAGLGPIVPATEYSTILCGAFGNPCVDYAVSGDQAADEVNNNIYPHLNPARYNNIPSTFMIGTNDANACGPSVGCENNFFHTLLSGAAWAVIPFEFKIQPQLGIASGNCTTTGTWTNTSYGNDLAISSTVPGSTLTCTSLTLGDPAVYANWFAADNLTSTATFSIDGTVVDTWDAFGFNGQTINTQHSLTQTAFGTRYPLTGSGSHTYTVTVGTAGSGNAFTFLWMGSPAPVPPVSLGGETQNPPRMAIAGVIRQEGDAQSATTAAYNALAISVPTELSADGAFAFPVNVRAFVGLDFATLDSDMRAATLPNGLVTATSTNPGLHPNGSISNGVMVGGSRHIADAFLATMPPPNQGQGTTTPTWLQNLGNGADGALLNANGNLSGIKWYTNFTVPFGNTITVNSNVGLVVHATGACTIAGTINGRGQDFTAGSGYGGGASGGSGAGAANGFAGTASFASPFLGAVNKLAGGAAGVSPGGNGGNPAAALVNTQREVIGGGGGVVILSSQSPIITPPAIYVAGGPGSLATVPEALGIGGTCTTQPKATLGVASGALSGTATVVQAGAGCGTGAGVTFAILGGGGTQGTATFNPTWSGGSLASATVTPGTSSGYTANTWTESGTGGDGNPGWIYLTTAGW
jgi:hypothetical protein